MQSPRYQVAKEPVSGLSCTMCGAHIRNLQKHLKNVVHTAVFTQQKPKHTPQEGSEERGTPTLRRARTETFPLVRAPGFTAFIGNDFLPGLRQHFEEKEFGTPLPSCASSECQDRQAVPRLETKQNQGAFCKHSKFVESNANLCRPSETTDGHESQSVWTVGGGLPDTKRSRH